MFMSKAELFHESSWALWFQHAAGLLPLSAAQTMTQVTEDGLSISTFSVLYLHLPCTALHVCT